MTVTVVSLLFFPFLFSARYSHGESWYNFRSKVQQVMLQPRIARMYVGAIEEASTALLHRSVKFCMSFVLSFTGFHKSEPTLLTLTTWTLRTIYLPIDDLLICTICFFFSLCRISKIRDEKYEMPDDFLNEMHKWSLECKFSLLEKNTRLTKIDRSNQLWIILLFLFLLLLDSYRPSCPGCASGLLRWRCECGYAEADRRVDHVFQERARARVEDAILEGL